VEQQCQTAEVSRAGFYRYLHQTKPKQADMLFRARLQQLAVAHHRLRGYRMLSALLRRRFCCQTGLELCREKRLERNLRLLDRQQQARCCPGAWPATSR
jgi:hypothetical protein